MDSHSSRPTPMSFSTLQSWHTAQSEISLGERESSGEQTPTQTTPTHERSAPRDATSRTYFTRHPDASEPDLPSGRTDTREPSDSGFVPGESVTTHTSKDGTTTTTTTRRFVSEGAATAESQLSRPYSDGEVEPMSRHGVSTTDFGAGSQNGQPTGGRMGTRTISGRFGNFAREAEIVDARSPTEEKSSWGGLGSFDADLAGTPAGTPSPRRPPMPDVYSSQSLTDFIDGRRARQASATRYTPSSGAATAASARGAGDAVGLTSAVHVEPSASHAYVTPFVRGWSADSILTTPSSTSSYSQESTHVAASASRDAADASAIRDTGASSVPRDGPATPTPAARRTFYDAVTASSSDGLASARLDQPSTPTSQPAYSSGLPTAASSSSLETGLPGHKEAMSARQGTAARGAAAAVTLPETRSLEKSWPISSTAADQHPSASHEPTTARPSAGGNGLGAGVGSHVPASTTTSQGSTPVTPSPLAEQNHPASRQVDTVGSAGADARIVTPAGSGATDPVTKAADPQTAEPSSPAKKTPSAVDEAALAGGVGAGTVAASTVNDTGSSKSPATTPSNAVDATTGLSHGGANASTVPSTVTAPKDKRVASAQPDRYAPSNAATNSAQVPIEKTASAGPKESPSAPRAVHPRTESKRAVPDSEKSEAPSEAERRSAAAPLALGSAVAAEAALAAGSSSSAERNKASSSSETTLDGVRRKRSSGEKSPKAADSEESRDTTVAPASDKGSVYAASSDSSRRSSVARPESRFQPLRTTSTAKDVRPGMPHRKSIQTEDDLFKVLSQRRTNKTDVDDEEERDEVEKLMSRMFGKARQAHSEEEKTRHSGVVWRDLTVKGVGLGASLQPTVGDIFLGLPRFLKNLLTKGPKAALGKPPVRELLSNFDGCVRPGEILLVLGRPGSGCSTFLKTFCNQRAGYAAVEGEVTYGGTDHKRMAKDFRSDILYNPEDDLHYATLTVKRTLNFALQTRAPGKESRLEGEGRAEYIREFLRVATKLLWIEHTLGTKVGNEYIRGVSGGERKRVSIAEALITRASIQGWDNSSKGLDASTAVEYVQSLRTLTNMAQVSTAVSLYQAGESLYNLVDKVLLIEAGQCLYYGSSEDAKQYFLDLGFDCPDRWTTADFLTSVTDEHERSVKDGWEEKIPRSPADFAAVYRNSGAYQKNLRDMKDFEAQLEQQRRNRLENRSKKNKKKNYTIPFHKQVIACTKRQFLVMLGDRASLVGKWGGIVFQGLIVGSLFYDLPGNTNGAFTRGGVIFFILLFNALLALAEQTAAFESKPILLKHKNFSFYRPSAYALAQTVVDVPLVLIQVVLFDVIIYWMAGLAASASQFFISILTLWLVTMATYAFFRAISALCKTLDDATKITGVAIQILVVYTGYLIPPAQMHPWFGWLRFVNWIQYGFEMLMANEFYNLEMECVPPYLVPQGPDASPEYQSCTLAGSRPGQITVHGGEYIQAAFSYTRSHLWRNFGIVWAFFGFFLFLTCLGMEVMKPNAGGAALTVFKRGQVPKKVEQAIQTGGRKGGRDEENSPRGGHVEKHISSADDAQGPDEDRVMRNVAKNEAVFTFQNINYTIPYQGGERTLLQDVQGFVRPGKLTALMGASGAGKTTLLNTLAQRINFGSVAGDFLVDGRPLPKSFQRATGFAEQMDVHEPTATVREALQFSALLRQPREVSKKEKYAYCETILDLLEMRDIAGATIGKIGEGLNQEQRKRLTIGVELASKPELLFFLDEPTSGLDSGAAFNIVRFLRKLADAGQAILCTIHQPSAVLFEHFDDLVLLKSGGRVVYSGELGQDSQTMIRYFEEHEGGKCPPDANPAEWMLEVIGAGNPDYDGPDYGDVWRSSRQHEEQSREIESTIAKRKTVEHSQNVRDDREYAMPLSTQTVAVVKRAFIAFWRTPNYVMGMMFLHILTGLFNCFTFYHLGYASIDFQSRLFTIFMTLTISPPLIQQLQPMFLASRNIFQSRENNAKIYSWFAWTTGVILVEIPYRVVAGGIYFCCWWWGIMGYRISGFASGFTFLLVIIFELYYLGFGQAIAAFSPNDLLASLLVPLFFLFVVSFCGVVVPPQQLPYFWRSWMYWLTPFHYLLEAFLGVAVHDQRVVCNTNEFARFNAPPGQTCASYAEPYIQQAGGYVQTGLDGVCEFCQYATGDEFGAGFSVYYDHRWRDFGIMCAFVGFNFVVVYVATWMRFRGKNPFKGVLSNVKQKRSKQ